MPRRLAVALFAIAAIASAGVAPEAVPGQKVQLHGVLTNLTSGGRVDLASETKGKKTLVFLWDTWCGACTAKIPDMNATYRSLKDRADVRFLSVCGDNGYEGANPNETSESKAAAHVRKQQILYPALFDTAQTKVSTQFGDADFPNLFLLDGDGTVVASWNSEGGYEQFMAKARKYLGFAL
jgi:peroxiredoxin